MGKKYIILAALLLTVGLGILLYPVVSSTVNRISGSYAISEHLLLLDNMGQEEREKQLEQAREYNRQLLEEGEGKNYDQILDLGSGIMGHIRIPAINVNLPIYHGVDESVLSKGAGHLPGSGFPVGGEGNHAVITGHTGLPSAVLFTDLIKLKEGDRFYIHVLEEKLCYQIDQIKVVLPSEGQDLMPQPGRDYCTLVTCTPYGVNSHRLLLRGVRVEEPAYTAVETEVPERKSVVFLWLLIPVGLLIPVVWILKRRLDGRGTLPYNG